MALLKISRDANRPKRDNLVDIVGYTRNIEMIDEELVQRAVFKSKTRQADDQFDGALYVAGPMRGYKRYNFDMFEKVTKSLRFSGFKVVSPHEHDLEMGLNPDEMMTDEEEKEFLKEAFSWDVQAIRMGKGIVLLPGWEKSAGARTEATVALFCGKEIWVWDPIDTEQLIRIANPEELEEIRRKPDESAPDLLGLVRKTDSLNRPPLGDVREIERPRG
jgi:hypothetical protein